MNRILVTGADGFIGRHLCPELLRAGMQVRKAVRSMAVPEAHAAEYEIQSIGEIGRETDWRTAVSGVDTIVHLAARTHVLDRLAARDLSGFRETNVEGTRLLAEAATGAGVRRFLYLSSIKAAGESSARYSALTEQAPCTPADAYGISKREAEEALLNLPRSPMDVVILRPPLVYGPGVKANFLRFMRVIDRGIPLPLGGVASKRSLLYVENLVNAIILLIGAPGVRGELFHVADDEAVSTAELAVRLGAKMGRRPRLLRVPAPWLRAAGRFFGRTEDVRRLTGALVLSTEKIRRVAGWAPPFQLDEGLKRTADWYRHAFH